MDDALNIIALPLIAVVIFGAVKGACARTPALRHGQTLLYALGCAICVLCAAKVFYLDRFIPPFDQVQHEYNARYIAESLEFANWTEVFHCFGLGNAFYQFVLGLFYRITGAPEGVTYAVNGALGFLGMLSLLETIAVCTHARKIPTWLILLICASPTMLFFSTLNMKEGANLWAACTALRFAKYNVGRLSLSDVVMGTIGFAVLYLFRAHFAAAWTLAVGFTILVKRRNVVLAVTLLSMTVGAMPALKYAKPAMFDELISEGVTDTAAQHYRRNSDSGGSAIRHFGGGPIPFASGFALLFLRPYPNEVFDIFSFGVAAEVWCITMLIAFSWYRVKSRWQLAQNPLVVTSLVCLVFMCFLFSYQYNMGLMVRHRLQVFPAFYMLLSVAVLLPATTRFATPKRPRMRRWPSRPVQGHAREGRQVRSLRSAGRLSAARE